MYAISFEISAFFLSLLCFAYCLTAKRKQYVPPKGISRRAFDQHFQFLMMLVTNMISSISSVIGVYLTSIQADGITFWQYLFHALYFLFHTTLSLAFGLYIISVTNGNLKNNKVLNVLFFIPYTVAELLILTNHWTGWCFYMDAQSIYHRGPLMLLLYGLGAFYIVVGFVTFIRHMKAITRADSIAVGLFIIIAALGIVVQAVKSDWLVELFAEALACLVIMMVLEEKAGHIDQMTALLNRFAFSENVKRRISGKQPFDLVIIKVTGIGNLVKRFNERTTDEFLLQFATYLSVTATTGTVYSYRRGEFMATFENVGEEASSYAEKVLERFHSSWKLSGVEILMDGMVAVVNAPKDIQSYDEIEDLMSAYASYQPSEKGSCLIPHEEVRSMILLHEYEDSLRHVVAEQELAVYFQPIYSLKDKATISAEALLRVPVAPFNAISPEIYIPIAEKTGLIREIGLFVFEEVCKFLKEDSLRSSAIRYIELNLSIYQFLSQSLVQDFEGIRKKYGVPASKINLEVTESGNALDKDEVLRTLEEFRSLDYTLSLDDFGTGYSNFVRMVRCKFDNIKIDKSILWDLGKEENGLETLRSLTSFIKLQGSSIVQEGVETKEQLDLAETCDVDYIQGFYFGKAMPKDEFYQYLENEANRVAKFAS